MICLLYLLLRLGDHCSWKHSYHPCLGRSSSTTSSLSVTFLLLSTTHKKGSGSVGTVVLAVDPLHQHMLGAYFTQQLQQLLVLVLLCKQLLHASPNHARSPSRFTHARPKSVLHHHRRTYSHITCVSAACVRIWCAIVYGSNGSPSEQHVCPLVIADLGQDMQ